MVREATTTRLANFSLLQLALPAKAPLNIGVLLLDPATDHLYKKLRRDWNAIADPGNVEVLELLDQDFEQKIGEMGGDAFLRSLEDVASNTLLISTRGEVNVVSTFEKALNRLFEEHVQRTEVIPFVTHVPLYALRAAATKFGEDLEVEAEPEEWVPAPPRLKLHRLMFAARVVGRSMEPLIPDGSLCLFRGGVVGSRQGKRLLIQRIGATDTSAEFTVKQYTSEKEALGEDQWAHIRIILKPLNPEFETMEFGPEDEHRQFRVIAEFLQVLE
jgi:phage repressor protein C with HTH and peptisase S24 domain